MKTNPYMSRVSQEEEMKFGKYSMIERQCMYARGVLVRHITMEYKRLRAILKYKFGTVALTKKQIEGVMLQVKERK